MIIGFVDSIEKNQIRGWAMDSENPLRKLRITLNDGNKELKSGIADQERQDLIKFGDSGKFGFNIDGFDIININNINIKAENVELKILKFMENINQNENSNKIMFKQIACDITNHCNNRCNFCFNKWGKPASMNKEFFIRFIKIAPVYVKEWLLMSCLYEPTLHKQICEFLEIIPEDMGKKIFLTTNIARPLSDEFFIQLAKSNIHHVNISLETLNKEKYIEITKNKTSHFYKNLQRCASVFRKYKNGPKLHLITMVSRDNFNELKKIAQYAHDELNVDKHDFRTPFFSREIPKEWLLAHTLTRTELNMLKYDLEMLDYHNIYMDLTRDTEYYAKTIYDHDYNSPRQYIPIWQPTPEESNSIPFIGAGKMLPRVNANGYFTMDELPYAWNLHKIRNLNQFFEFAINIAKK